MLTDFWLIFHIDKSLELALTVGKHLDIPAYPYRITYIALSTTFFSFAHKSHNEGRLLGIVTEQWSVIRCFLSVWLSEFGHEVKQNLIIPCVIKNNMQVAQI